MSSYSISGQNMEQRKGWSLAYPVSKGIRTSLDLTFYGRISTPLQVLHMVYSPANKERGDNGRDSFKCYASREWQARHVDIGR